jgi:two-component system aerobic respiration control sensor histidine kinase ArcB
VKSGKDNLHAVGTGIGLSVSRQLIQRMGGDIFATSELGYGSTFTVTISVPIVELDQTLLGQDVEMTPLNIFMVEDIELNVTVARSLLESLGHNVTVAMTGTDALATFEPTKFDLVLLDIQLPDMTGFDVLSSLQQQHDNLPPIVALTANVIKDKSEYRNVGMVDALSKPLSVKALKKVIAKYTQQQEFLDLALPESRTYSVQSPERVIPNDKELNNLLDIEMLDSYIDMVGGKIVLDGIEVFEQCMPGYVKILRTNLMAKDQKLVVEESHKIKGAAGSIGLKRLQAVAQKAQSPDLPAWWDNIDEWVEELASEYKKDIQLLKTWIREKQK